MLIDVNNAAAWLLQHFEISHLKMLRRALLLICVVVNVSKFWAKAQEAAVGVRRQDISEIWCEPGAIVLFLFFFFSCVFRSLWVYLAEMRPSLTSHWLQRRSKASSMPSVKTMSTMQCCFKRSLFMLVASFPPHQSFSKASSRLELGKFYNPLHAMKRTGYHMQRYYFTVWKIY